MYLFIYQPKIFVHQHYYNQTSKLLLKYKKLASVRQLKLPKLFSSNRLKEPHVQKIADRSGLYT